MALPTARVGPKLGTMNVDNAWGTDTTSSFIIALAAESSYMPIDRGSNVWLDNFRVGNSINEARPFIQVPPGHKSILPGQEATLGVTAAGVNLNYQWQKNGVNIPGATGDLYKIPGFSLSDEGLYRVWSVIQRA